jgi:FkbM family methyltransferase
MITNKFIRALLNPGRAWRFFLFVLSYYLRKKRGILFIVGLESGGVFRWMYRAYETCYCFEPNPERFKKLQKKYSKYRHIKLYNVAVAQYDGEISFNISSNNNGASSSVGHFNKEWQEQNQIEIIKTITVPCINLNNFCSKNDIHFINDYVSDIQGMDLEVLKTLKPMIDNKMIGTITCEVTKNEKGNIYYDLPDNSEKGFEDLLKANYELIAKGWGYLKDNKFDRIPDNVWEFDSRWRLK